MNAMLKTALAMAAVAISAQAVAGPTFYEREDFEGRSFTTNQPIRNLERIGFNDSASSVVVTGSRWEVCEDVRFSGRCVVLRPGRYPSLAAMGLNNRVSSVRSISRNTRVDNSRYAPDPNVAAAQVVFYQREGFQGRTFTATQEVRNFERVGFNDRASSAVVTGDRWEVCEDARFSGRCVVLRPGRYPSLAAMGLNNRVSSVRDVGKNAQIDNNRFAPDPVGTTAQVVFYEREGFQGRSFTTQQQIGNLERAGFNDRASSVVVFGDRWEVCEDTRFSGRCVVLRPGRYPSLAAMGLDNRVSSVRDVSRNDQIENHRYAPAPGAVYDNRRRNDERLYQANVTSVRAVAGTPGQRCWLEQEQVPQQSRINVPGALVGAAIGGVLGHQVGSGRGNDIATVGGAVIGGAVGANVGRGQQMDTRDVQRCENVSSQFRPDYWDVTYNFRGQEHRMQMTTAPGPTVTVNERGEPRS